MKRILITIVFISVLFAQVNSQTPCENVCFSQFEQCNRNADFDRGICEDTCWTDYWNCNYSNPGWSECRVNLEYTLWLCGYSWYYNTHDCDNDYNACIAGC